ncbi:hypothetical protein EVAR_26436_1 [Eumeta japonica]|uniref:Uncharacterized protein n=1 Tax=Eumeta variegata TaxID=151549 RepID=A0A4C1VQW1_EUMVA|nr:hypothetical protein EVAR_26436_1 [Eumeta japonica]
MYRIEDAHTQRLILMVNGTAGVGGGSALPSPTPLPCPRRPTLIPHHTPNQISVTYLRVGKPPRIHPEPAFLPTLRMCAAQGC